MKDATYIKVLTWEKDPNSLLKKININADRIILKWSKTQDMTKGIYRYNAFILYAKYFDENYIFPVMNSK